MILKQRCANMQSVSTFAVFVVQHFVFSLLFPLTLCGLGLTAYSFFLMYEAPVLLFSKNSLIIANFRHDWIAI